MRVLVLGAAVSGIAAARLAARLGHRVTVYDRDPGVAPDVIAHGIAALAGQWDRGNLDGVDLVVASPGFPERSVPITDAYEEGVAVESEIEFAWRHLDLPTVAVTGTNGKTTVTGLVAEMLRGSGIDALEVGNIGHPLSDVVGSGTEAIAVEVSSFQLQLCRSFRPDVAVITNIAEDHLDWHGSAASYRSAKARIGMNQGPDDLIIFPESEKEAAEAASHSRARPVPIPVGRVVDGLGVGADAIHLGGATVPLEEMRTTEPPFLIDIVLAAAAAGGIGGSPEAAAEVARRFEPGAHRRKRVLTHAGVDYIDDSKATNPHAAIAAIDSYESVILIAGGLAKGLDIATIVSRPSIRRAFVMGESAAILASAAPDRTEIVDSMDEAVRRAVEVAVAGDVVLLSPGGASFDMFESYQERGDRFSSAVIAHTAGSDS